jgi:hypothetical protein
LTSQLANEKYASELVKENTKVTNELIKLVEQVIQVSQHLATARGGSGGSGDRHLDVNRGATAAGAT